MVEKTEPNALKRIALISAIALLVNYVWEMLQMPFFEGKMTPSEPIQMRTVHPAMPEGTKLAIYDILTLQKHLNATYTTTNTAF